MYTQQQIDQLQDFFSYKRPHGSKEESVWIHKYIIESLIAMGYEYTMDGAKNLHIDNRIKDKQTPTPPSRTLFIAHTDTVHHKAGRQKTYVDNNILKLHPYSAKEANCLGADDGAGVFVLLSLMKAGVAGYYIFSRGEECGGIGAKYLVEHGRELLGEFDRAIAFDRRGTSSVITHQGWGRCCSNEFADALSDALSDEFIMYAPDDTGVYTDTAEFVDIISECTNISVGYMDEHTTGESLDLTHLYHLVNRAININWESLPATRNPEDIEGGVVDFGFDVKDYGFTEYNSDVYDALSDALTGDADEILWLIATAVHPTASDEVYARIWSAKPSKKLIARIMRKVDEATSDESTDDALVEMFHELLNEMQVWQYQ
jgi:hypothetical protein